MKVSMAVRSLGALAQGTRLGAFRRLVRAGPEGLPAGDLARHLDVPPPTLSFHLKQLLDAELVTVERRGRLKVYAANYRSMNRLLQYLTENCCSE